MLPDIPKTKNELHTKLMTFMKHTIDLKHPLLAQLKSMSQHEGALHEYEQVGTGTVSEGYQPLQVPITISFEEVPDLVGERLFAKAAGIAEEMGKQQMKMFFGTLDKVIEQAGNKIDAQGPMTAENILRLIEMTQVDFDAKGKPTSTFVIHPDMVETAKKINEQIENDPELKARADSIRNQHYQSWLDRESNRKLVD